ncbi:hypothetical protein AB0I81_09835 [Nonomuraea sp. NPDC050404]|uniref:hypothetical protein n=1 Tax=Nonomuraea sp. NPDC050404 TaxID=3155783 RepID=UPI0033E5E449
MHHEEQLSALAPLAGLPLHDLAAGLATALHDGHRSGVRLAPGLVFVGPGGVRLEERNAPVPLEFVAPEVLSGAARGPASEVYAWGKVMLYAATGSPSLDQDLRILPEPLRGLVARAVAEQPERRPTTEGILSGLREVGTTPEGIPRGTRGMGAESEAAPRDVDPASEAWRQVSQAPPPAPERSRRRPWLWAGLVSTLVIALVAGGVVVLRSELFPPDAAGAGGEAVRAGEPLRADRVFAPASKAAPGAGLDQSAMAAATVGRTMVVVGIEAVNFRAAFRPLFMVSTDGGDTWRAASSSQRTLTGAFPQFVAGGPKGWVSLPSNPGAELTGWTSRDGERWDVIPAEGAAGMKDAGITGLVATRDGFVAVGMLDDPTAVVWTSADGRRWERAATGVDLPHGISNTLVAHGDQVIVAGSPPNTTDRSDDGPMQVLARSSDGGRTWQRATPPTDGLTWRQAEPFAKHNVWYATNGKTFYAAYNEGDRTRVVRSQDGAAWQPVGTYEGGTQKAAGLAVGPTGFYLLSRGQGGSKGTIVHSRNGSAWTPLGSSAELDGSDLLPLLLPTATGLLVRRDGGNGGIGIGGVTLDSAPGGQRLRLLAATPGKGLVPFDFPDVKELTYPMTRVEALGHRDGHTVAVGQSLGMASAWWSTDDGVTWTRSSLEVPGDLTGLVSGPEGWLAVGNAGAYASRDGRTWQRTAAEAGGLLYVAAAKDSYLLMGVKEGKPVLWRSTDLSTWQKVEVSADIPRALAGGELGYVFTTYFCPGSAASCMWFSADGLSWKRLEGPAVARDETVTVDKVAVGSDALVITGSIRPRTLNAEAEPFAARSSGASGTWEKTTSQESLLTISAAGEGYTGLRSSGKEIEVVRSGDGLTWKAAASTTAGGGTLSAGVEISGAFLATGHVRTMTEDYPIVWRVPAS